MLYHLASTGGFGAVEGGISHHENGLSTQEFVDLPRVCNVLYETLSLALLYRFGV